MLESSWVHVVSLAPWRFPSLSCFNVSSFALLCFLFSVVFSFLVSVFSICLLVTSCFTLKCTFLSCVSFTFLDYVHPSNLETFVDMLQWSSVYPSKHFDAEHCCLFLTSVGEMMLEFQPYLLGCTCHTCHFCQEPINAPIVLFRPAVGLSLYCSVTILKILANVGKTKLILLFHISCCCIGFWQKSASN